MRKNFTDKPVKSVTEETAKDIRSIAKKKIEERRKAAEKILNKQHFRKR
jgi:ATP-dependent Zn protease